MAAELDPNAERRDVRRARRVHVVLAVLTLLAFGALIPTGQGTSMAHGMLVQAGWLICATLWTGLAPTRRRGRAVAMLVLGHLLAGALVYAGGIAHARAVCVPPVMCCGYGMLIAVYPVVWAMALGAALAVVGVLRGLARLFRRVRRG